MSLDHLLSLKFVPQKVQSVPFLEHLEKFHLDLRSSIYSNYPEVTCLGMNPGRSWNPNLEESYLLEYSEYEVETPQVSSELVSPIETYEIFPKVTYFRIVQHNELAWTATCNVPDPSTGEEDATTAAIYLGN